MKQKTLFDTKENHIESGAEFSLNRKYRYALWRVWDRNKPFVMFIGLNPSTAAEYTDDATVRRVKSLSKQWGYGGFYMMNCFPYISTNPKDLLLAGSDATNDLWLKTIAALCKDVVFAWGNFEVVKLRKRDVELSKMFPNAKALIKNKNGSPRHPLYVPSTVELIKY